MRSTGRGPRGVAIIVNVGAGSFQQFLISSTCVWHSTATKMNFGGDGHNYWHVRDLEQYALEGTNTGKLYGEKLGFCFYDNYKYNLGLPGPPAAAQYTSTNSCKTRNDGTVLMGLSIGWGDIYPYNITDQYSGFGTARVDSRSDDG